MKVGPDDVFTPVDMERVYEDLFNKASSTNCGWILAHVGFKFNPKYRRMLIVAYPWMTNPISGDDLPSKISEWSGAIITESFDFVHGQKVWRMEFQDHYFRAGKTLLELNVINRVSSQ